MSPIANRCTELSTIGTEKSWKDGLLYYSVGDCYEGAISYAVINLKREREVKKKEDIES